jgi:hypothetical protein
VLDLSDQLNEDDSEENEKEGFDSSSKRRGSTSKVKIEFNNTTASADGHDLADCRRSINNQEPEHQQEREVVDSAEVVVEHKKGEVLAEETAVNDESETSHSQTNFAFVNSSQELSQAIRDHFEGKVDMGKVENYVNLAISKI